MIRLTLPGARRRGQRGAAAVEFALVLMPLLLILIAIIQFSVYFWSYQGAANAAREGARAWAVDPCDKDATPNNTLAQQRVGSAAAGGAGSVAVGHTFSGATPPVTGDSVSVTVTFTPYKIGAGMVPFMPNTVTKSAVARVESTEACG